ncbi:MAG: NAD(+) synthase [Candidatus Fimenecus sp.]
MKTGFIKVAAVSPAVTVGNVEKNCNEIINMLEKAKNQKVQIAVFPELSLCGYTCGDLFHQKVLIDACYSGIMRICEYSKSFNGYIAVGSPIKYNGKLYNCAVMIYNGKILGIVPKTYMPNYNEYYELRWFESGKGVSGVVSLWANQTVKIDSSLIFTLNEDTKIGIEICEDLWAPCPPSISLAQQGANIILNLSASNEAVTKNDYRKSLVKQQSARLFCAYAYASAGVGESTTDLVFSGACTVAENGSLLAEGERFSLDGTMAVADIDIDKLNAMRQLQNTFICDNNSNTVFTDKELPFLDEAYIERDFDPNPFVPTDEKERDERCREILAIQSSGLAKRMLHTKAQKLVLGISGGLDSTLALLVAVHAMEMLKLPNENIICITMPGFGTTDLTYSNACALVKSLGATLKEINIKDACIQHFKDIGHDAEIHDVTYENTQARERTQILMDYANKVGGLLVGTGDLSELALGWCTYNGDHMSMYGVNASVPKTLVRHLVRNIADNSGRETAEILYNVLDTPVSPELLPPDKDGKIEQKTEDTLGPYEVHDFYLYHFLRFGAKPEKLLFMAKKAFRGAYDEEMLRKWLEIFIKRFFNSQFKRSCLPDGPKVGSVSLSPRGDWRMPSDASYEEWLKF